MIIPSDVVSDKDMDFKEQVEHVEDRSGGNIPVQDGAIAAEIELLRLMSPEDFAIEERKLLRKIDFTLLPTLFILLILNYLDRNALASARVQGIEKSLGLVGTQFNSAISLLFVGYILGQIPSNMILSRPDLLFICQSVSWSGRLSHCAPVLSRITTNSLLFVFYSVSLKAHTFLEPCFYFRLGILRRSSPTELLSFTPALCCLERSRA